MNLSTQWKKTIRVTVPACLLTVTALVFHSTSASAAAPDGSYSLYFSDEFNDAAVNQNDWFFRDAPVIADGNGYNRKENVRESDGLLHIDFKSETVDGHAVRTGGGIITKKAFGYGYYEMRGKLFKETAGFHTSFWSMGLSNHLAANNVLGLDAEIAAGNLPYYNQATEIDGFEYDSPYNYMKSGTYTWLLNEWGGQYAEKHHSFNFTKDDWHVFAYDWAPTYIKYYLDGQLVFTIDTIATPQPYSQANFWLTGLPYQGLPDVTKLPGESQFDYFRYYSKSYPGTNQIANPGMELRPEETFRGYTDQDTPTWIETGDKTASFMTTPDAHSGKRSLKHASTSDYQVTTKQILHGLANGVYSLSAWVKSSGGQATAKMSVLDYGGTEQFVNVPAASDWTKITLDNVQVTNGQATVAFTSYANSTQWMLVDDVNFGEKMVYQAESLPVSTSAGDSQANYNDTAAGVSFNNLNSNSPGDYVQYTLNVSKPGTYAVYSNNRVAANKGMYQLSVNDANVGGVVDQYAAASGYTEGNVGVVTIGAAGSQTLRFTVTGKNALSSGHSLGFDSIRLVDCTTIYEAESLPATTSYGDGQSNLNDSSTGTSFNMLNANGIGDYVQYTLNVADPGTYTVYATSRIANNKGSYQLSVNGTNLGEVVDQYSAASGYSESNLGTVTMTGNQTFRFTVTGKNGASSDYDLAFDSIKLVKN
ncbi:family 16 glycosylhydrolase [Paenibacillus herberti]|uniref:GH16 domain-containing protein n=1 Tax=Paenibacillus herberti TaxID=1619309 RepID=A0A229P2A2_9BACL|nr:family 16 glycosylhydrolase [Paenibacillus herberti]OXM16393.1 hypothetical protein CGZ75_06880 [Paenibacillus herberti]